MIMTMSIQCEVKSFIQQKKQQQHGSQTYFFMRFGDYFLPVIRLQIVCMNLTETNSIKQRILRSNTLFSCQISSVCLFVSPCPGDTMSRKSHLLKCIFSVRREQVHVCTCKIMNSFSVYCNDYSAGSKQITHAVAVKTMPAV